MTILNPDGATLVIFRSDELTCSSVEAAGIDETDATLCPIYSTRMLLQVDSNSSAKGIRLDGGEIGDEVKIFRINGGDGFKVYKPDGGLLLNLTGHAVATLLPDGWGWTD